MVTMMEAKMVSQNALMWTRFQLSELVALPNRK